MTPPLLPLLPSWAGLSGTVPEALHSRRRRLLQSASASGSMQSLDLSNNPSLSGTIPSTIYQLGPLTSIRFANTKVKFD